MPTQSSPDRSKRFSTRHRGLSYRVRADGSRTYAGYIAGRQVPVGTNEKDALAKYSELRGKAARGEQVVPTQLKFGVVAEEWYASKEKRLRRWTLVNYRAALDNVLLPRFGNFKVGQISTAHVASLIRDLEAKDLSRSTIDNALKPLQGTLRFAMSRGLVGVNPLANLTVDERPPHAPRAVFEWSPESISKLLAASRELAAKPTTRYNFEPLLALAVRTGLRLGEILGLQWADLELGGDAPSLHVRRQLTRLGDLAEPKTTKALRRVPLSASLARFMAEHKMASPFSQDEDLVFAGPTGGPLSHRNVQRQGFKKAAEAAELEGVSFHSLRHAAASQLIAAGISPIVLADLLGHSSSAITLGVYAHLFDRTRSDGAVRAAMEAAMRG